VWRDHRCARDLERQRQACAHRRAARPPRQL